MNTIEYICYIPDIYPRAQTYLPPFFAVRFASYLMNLSMDNTSCQMNPPKFQHNVTMCARLCQRSWEMTQHVEVSP